jgi:hypothetical protein
MFVSLLGTVITTYAYNTADELIVMRGEKIIARTPFKYTPKYRGAVWTLDEPPIQSRAKLPSLSHTSLLASTTEGALVVGVDQYMIENYYLLNVDGSATFIGTRDGRRTNKAGKKLLRGIRQVVPVRIGRDAPAFAVSAEFADPDSDCAITSEAFFISPSSKSLIDTDMSPVMPLGQGNPLAIAHSIWWGSDGRLHAVMIASLCDGTSVLNASGERVPALLSTTTGERVLDTNRWVQVSHDKLYSVQDLDAATRLVASGEPDYKHKIRLDLETKGRRIKLADDIVTISTLVTSIVVGRLSIFMMREGVLDSLPDH